MNPEIQQLRQQVLALPPDILGYLLQSKAGPAPNRDRAQELDCLYIDWLTKDGLDPCDFFMGEIRHYLFGIALFLTGQDGRPACTPANVAAVAQSPDYKQVLARLVADEHAEPFVRHFQQALAAGAEPQVARLLTLPPAIATRLAQATLQQKWTQRVGQTIKGHWQRLFT